MASLILNVFRFGEGDWAELTDTSEFMPKTLSFETDVGPQRSEFEISEKWRRIKEVSRSDILKLSSKDKLVTKLDWMIAAIRKLIATDEKTSGGNQVLCQQLQESLQTNPLQKSEYDTWVFDNLLK